MKALSVLWLYLSGKTKWSFNDISLQSIIADIFTVDDTTTIILSAFTADCALMTSKMTLTYIESLSQFNYSMMILTYIE